MDKITTKKQLLDTIEGIRAIEMTAKNSYISDIESFKNPKIINDITIIKNDEIRHIQLLDEIITILKE